MILNEVIAVSILGSIVVLGFIDKTTWYGELIVLVQWWAVIYLCLSVLGDL